MRKELSNTLASTRARVQFVRPFPFCHGMAYLQSNLFKAINVKPVIPVGNVNEVLDVVFHKEPVAYPYFIHFCSLDGRDIPFCGVCQ